MDRVAAAVAPSDTALGIYAGSADFAETWLAKGARYFATGVHGFLKQGMTDYLGRLRA